jgi:hypothetical protein
MWRLTVAVLSLGVAAEVAYAELPLTDSARAHHIDLMSAVLDDGNLAAFLSRAAAEEWVVPYIDSAWRVRNVTPVGERVAANAARRFGRQAYVTIDRQREQIWELSGHDLLQLVRSILDFGDWIGRREAYGNVLVQMRSRERALGGLGRLVVDLEFPLELVQRERQRLYGSLHPMSARLAALNREAGRALFPADIATIKEFSIYWSAGAANSRAAGQGQPLPDWAEEFLSALGIGRSSPDYLRDFFVDEPCPGPGTKLNCWENKRHKAIISELGFVKQLDALIEFRRVIGSFPLVPKKEWPPLDPGHVAFKDAWSSQMGPGNRRWLPGAAWVAYHQTQAKTFGDGETETMRLWLQGKKIREDARRTPSTSGTSR